MRGKIGKYRVNLNLFVVLFFSLFLVNVGFGATLNSYGTISGTVTILDNVPPEILNVTYFVATPGEQNNRSVTIEWETDENANSIVEFFKDGNWIVKASNSSFVKKHKIKISGLSEGNYTFRINSSDNEGNSAVSGNYNFTIEKVKEITKHVVINEIYGGGGNKNSYWKNDFIELYNPTSSPINISNWSIQYAPQKGKFKKNKVTITILSGTIPAHGFYLVQEKGGKKGSQISLPTPDTTGNIKMSKDHGKVALVNNTDVISGKNDSNVVDFVGYGNKANEYEGSGPASEPGNKKSIERKLPGYDTDNNSADFVIRETPTPTNSDGETIKETPDIVINEFLPVAGNYSEFIEFYNKGNTPQDLENWTIEIKSYGNFKINSNILWDGFSSTTIGAGSNNRWLVIDLSKVGGDLLGENDTIILYDNEGRKIDKVSYTNATMPDKSYARIPDGSANWVDPIPTPGKPNKLGNQTIVLNETGKNLAEDERKTAKVEEENVDRVEKIERVNNVDQEEETEEPVDSGGGK